MSGAVDFGYELYDDDGPTTQETSQSNADVPQLRTVCAANVQMRSIKWLRKPLLQGDSFTLVAGPKGVGKGTWLVMTAAAMTRGAFGPAQRVLFVSSEDSVAIDLVPRLAAAEADLDLVHVVVSDFRLPDDLDRLRQTAREIGDVGLIVIDPVGNHLGGADTDKEGAIRFALHGLNQLADELSCLIIGVRHLKKAREGGALASVLGSTAWVDLPRAVLAFAPDDVEAGVFHVQVVAGNRSGRGAGQSYRIELVDVGLGEPVTTCVELGDSTKDIDELLAAPRRPSKSRDARELILDILDAEGEQESDALDARVAADVGLAAKTVKNQRTDLANQGLIKNVPVKDQSGAVREWRVRRTSAPRP